MLDSLHLIKTDKLDLYVLVEVLDYLHYEGKTKLSLFEKRLAENLIETLIKMKLPMSTQILLCLAISTMDNYNNSFEKAVGASLAQVLGLEVVFEKNYLIFENPN